MASAALTRWRTERAQLLDQLMAAHAAIGGTGTGRRWTTEELNKALTLRLAAQFQGFAKDLHQEASLVFGNLAQPGDPTLASVIATVLQIDRRLDRGNANDETIASDFGRFGLRLWDAMEARHTRTQSRKKHLRAFNTARNALAHDDPDKLATLRQQGYVIDLKQIRRWRSMLDGLAGTMDEVLSAHLARLFSGPPPW